MATYLVLTETKKVICENQSRTLPLVSGYELIEGDENLIFPIVEPRTNDVDGIVSNYEWVVENPVQLDSYNSLLSEQEILKFEIMSEDYSADSLIFASSENVIQKLRKIARLRQLELILASGNF